MSKVLKCVKKHDGIGIQNGVRPTYRCVELVEFQNPGTGLIFWRVRVDNTGHAMSIPYLNYKDADIAFNLASTLV